MPGVPRNEYQHWGLAAIQEVAPAGDEPRWGDVTEALQHHGRRPLWKRQRRGQPQFKLWSRLLLTRFRGHVSLSKGTKPDGWRAAVRKRAGSEALLSRVVGLGAASCHICSDFSIHALYVLVPGTCHHGGGDLNIRNRSRRSGLP